MLVLGVCLMMWASLADASKKLKLHLYSAECVAFEIQPSETRVDVYEFLTD